MRQSSGFTEVQRFRQWWLLIIMLIPALIFSWGIVQQIFLHKPFGDKPMSDEGLISSLLIFIVFFIWFFAFLRLETAVDETGIQYDFKGFPLKKQLLKWEDIESARAVKYRPLLDYGGWGIRWGFHGKAYNVSGNMGIQIRTRAGANILIGTQDPEAFYSVVKNHLHRT